MRFGCDTLLTSIRGSPVSWGGGTSLIAVWSCYTPRSAWPVLQSALSKSVCVEFSWERQAWIWSDQSDVNALSAGVSMKHCAGASSESMSWRCTGEVMVIAQRDQSLSTLVHFTDILHRCQHGLRKMRESARNDILRAHANFARAHKMRANYHISIHAITLYKNVDIFVKITHLIVNCNMVLSWGWGI